MTDITSIRRDRLDTKGGTSTIPLFRVKADELVHTETTFKIYSRGLYDTFILNDSVLGSSRTFTSDAQWNTGTTTGTVTVSSNNLNGGASGGTWVSPIVYHNNSSFRTTIDNFNTLLFNGDWTEDTMTNATKTILADTTYVAQGYAYLSTDKTDTTYTVILEKILDNAIIMGDTLKVLHKGDLTLRFYSQGSAIYSWGSPFTAFDNWDYKKTITITETSGSNLTDYQINLIIDTATLVSAGKMESDGDDIRFVNSSGAALDYWIESGMNTSVTSIWVEVDSITLSTTTDIEFFYGYSSASAASSGADTFITFDDFSSDTIANYSSNDITDWSISGGYLKENESPGSYIYLTAAPTFTDLKQIVRVRLVATSYFFIEWRHDGDNDRYYAGPRVPDSLWRMYHSALSTLDTWASAPATANWYRIIQTAVGNEHEFYVDDVLRLSATDSTHTDAGDAMLWAASEDPVDIDYWAIGKQASSEPTDSFGAEAPTPMSYNYTLEGTYSTGSGNPSDWTETSIDTSAKDGTTMSKIQILDNATVYSGNNIFDIDALWTLGATRVTTFDDVTLNTSVTTVDILDASDDSVLQSGLTGTNINLKTYANLEGVNIKVRINLDAAEVVEDCVINHKPSLIGDNCGKATELLSL